MRENRELKGLLHKILGFLGAPYEIVQALLASRQNS
jgi:hypothetical protein